MTVGVANVGCSAAGQLMVSGGGRERDQQKKGIVWEPNRRAPVCQGEFSYSRICNMVCTSTTLNNSATAQ